MGTVRVSLTFPGTVHQAETCWYDTDRWPAWVDGLARVGEVQGKWPEPGSSVRWESGPAGRGRVLERVVGYEPLGGQTLEVEDESMKGRQSVAFTPEGESVQVELSLQYRIKRRTPVTPVVDLLFIRRAMAISLRKTLERFGAELAAARRGLVR
jgi:hypothetical protein